MIIARCDRCGVDAAGPLEVHRLVWQWSGGPPNDFDCCGACMKALTAELRGIAEKARRLRERRVL